jgi:hypothetical protein
LAKAGPQVLIRSLRYQLAQQFHTFGTPAIGGLAGGPDEARESYLRAVGMTASVPEQRYLALRAARLG